MTTISLHLKNWFLTLVALLLFASVSLADTTKVTLTSVGNGTAVGNVYVGPYVATLGSGSTAVSTYVLCDDWSDNTYLNESWTATIYTLSPLSGTPLFGNNQSLYNAMAWLGSHLLANPTDKTLQADISFAIWELSYGANNTAKETPAPTSSIYPVDQSVVAGLISQALNSGFDGSGWEILTPISGTASCPGYANSTCPSSPPQEFLVYAPESSAVVMLGADMFGLLALVFVFRRRLLRPTQ